MLYGNLIGGKKGRVEKSKAEFYRLFTDYLHSYCVVCTSIKNFESLIQWCGVRSAGVTADMMIHSPATLDCRLHCYQRFAIIFFFKNYDSSCIISFITNNFLKLIFKIWYVTLINALYFLNDCTVFFK